MLWKSGTIRKSNFDARTHDSWEEEAFAEDAAQPFGALVWPPRSYLCSFCRREFRSAQALGGHMNVHRRERARLKQCPSTPTPSSGHHKEDFHSTIRAAVSSNQDIDCISSSSWFVNVMNSERKEDQLEDLRKKRSRIQQDVLKLPDLCQEIVSNKRQRIDESSTEYLDLELRLGDQPSLKQIH